MITWHVLYTILTAVVPLYVVMILAYGLVRWWRIFSLDQCTGINQFVAIFAVPLLSFHFISTNNPYAMNFRFIAADTLQKLIVLATWARLSSRGSLDWAITVFSLATLPNTLVMGIPLLIAMYNMRGGGGWCRPFPRPSWGCPYSGMEQGGRGPSLRPLGSRNGGKGRGPFPRPPWGRPCSGTGRGRGSFPRCPCSETKRGERERRGPCSMSALQAVRDVSSPRAERANGGYGQEDVGRIRGERVM